MAKVRVGFIGAEQIAGLHARSYADNATGELYAVADIDPGAAEAQARRWGAERWFTDYREMPADPALDAVEVLLPHHLHAAATEAALAAGKHVSLQKPPALTIGETGRMIAAAARSGKVFRVFEDFRSYEPCTRARRLIEVGKSASGVGTQPGERMGAASDRRYQHVHGGVIPHAGLERLPY